jgi:hypothetical protein
MRPYFFPPRGVHSPEWTYADLVRDRYPVRLVNPDWLDDANEWAMMECRARRALIGGVVFVVIFCMGVKLAKRNETALLGLHQRSL